MATVPMTKRNAHDRKLEREVVEAKARELVEEELVVDAAAAAGSIDHTRQSQTVNLHALIHLLLIISTIS